MKTEIPNIFNPDSPEIRKIFSTRKHLEILQKECTVVYEIENRKITVHHLNHSTHDSIIIIIDATPDLNGEAFSIHIDKEDNKHLTFEDINILLFFYFTDTDYKKILINENSYQVILKN